MSEAMKEDRSQWTRSAFMRKAALAFAVIASGMKAEAGAFVPDCDGDDEPARQVTVMAIRARKGETKVDPKLEAVEPRLAQLLPNHAFTLLEGRSRRIAEDESIVMELKNGMKLTIRLIDSEDADGKVQMEVRLESGEVVHLKSTVRSPSNQLFFLDHKIDEPEHLLIAVGAR
jgi:hypothetical protein